MLRQIRPWACWAAVCACDDTFTRAAGSRNAKSVFPTARLPRASRLSKRRGKPRQKWRREPRWIDFSPAAVATWHIWKLQSDNEHGSKIPVRHRVQSTAVRRKISGTGKSAGSRRSRTRSGCGPNFWPFCRCARRSLRWPGAHAAPARRRRLIFRSSGPHR